MRSRTIVASLVGLTLTSCASSGTGDFQIVTEGGVSALVATQDGAGMEAEIFGTVVLTNGGCIALDSEGVVIPVLWPKGTTLDDGLALPSGVRLTMGDEFTGAGGEVSRSVLDGTWPDACSGTSVLVVN